MQIVGFPTRQLLYYFFRGEYFRPSYKEVAAIKSLVDAPLLLATATATSEMKNDLQLLFEIDELNTIAEVPDRYCVS